MYVTNTFFLLQTFFDFIVSSFGSFSNFPVLWSAQLRICVFFCHGNLCVIIKWLKKSWDEKTACVLLYAFFKFLIFLVTNIWIIWIFDWLATHYSIWFTFTNTNTYTYSNYYNYSINCDYLFNPINWILVESIMAKNRYSNSWPP